MRIGELAAKAGVGSQTLRYYERRGLLQKPPRSTSGYRTYTVEAVILVRFVKRAQELGFTLGEIQALLRLRNDHKAACSDVRASASAKIADIEEKIAHLQAIKKALGILVKSCTSRGSTRECPILEAIEQSGRRTG